MKKDRTIAAGRLLWFERAEFPCYDVTDCTPCDEQGPSDSTSVFDLHLLSTNETIGFIIRGRGFPKYYLATR